VIGDWRAAAGNAAPAPIHLVQGEIHSRLSENKRVPNCTKRARGGAAEESEEAWQPRRRAGWVVEREDKGGFIVGERRPSAGEVGPEAFAPGRLFFFDALLALLRALLLPFLWHSFTSTCSFKKTIFSRFKLLLLLTFLLRLIIYFIIKVIQIYKIISYILILFSN
jgi:hypothetical protein